MNKQTKMLLGLALVAGKKIIESPTFKTGVAKVANYFNKLSPTKKMLFLRALEGITSNITSKVD